MTTAMRQYPLVVTGQTVGRSVVDGAAAAIQLALFEGSACLLMLPTMVGCFGGKDGRTEGRKEGEGGN